MTHAAALSFALLFQVAQQGAGLSYKLPDGWTEARNPATGFVVLAPRRLPLLRVVRVDLFTPEPTFASAEAYHQEIIRRATTGARPIEQPRTSTSGSFLATRLHHYMPNGLQVWVTVYTARWADRGQALLFSANTADMEQRYLAVVDTMVGRIVVPGAEVAALADRRAAPPSTDPPRSGGREPSTLATFADYMYWLPDGYTPTPAGNGLWLVSPPSETGERCTLGLWPLVPSSGDLFNDANGAWAQLFKDLEIRQTGAASLVRAVSPQGWEYVVVSHEMARPGTPDPEMFGWIMAAKVGNRVAVISWLSKSPSYSTCLHFYTGLPKVWPRFFANLQFRGWSAPAENGLARQIQGVWGSIGTSTGGGASLEYTFNAASRYAFVGVGQRYMALSQNLAAVWTSTAFGDGSYSVRGNELTIKPDRGDSETYFIRFEQLSKDGGRNWTEKLYMMRPEAVAYVNGTRREDSEVALERRKPLGMRMRRHAA